MLINVVSDIPPNIWEREVPPGLRNGYVHTRFPVEADFHVIYGLRVPLRVPNSRDRIAFVASEPPEIRKYSRGVLERYGHVFGPEFSYLAAMANFTRLSPVAPWWAGTNAGGKDHYSGVSEQVSLLRTDFMKLAPPERDILSMIVSSKARTPLQIQRLRLADYLQSKMNEIEIWGEGKRFAHDKALVLGSSRYHLAIENSVHRGYWTEKLADPILLSNYLFYQGAPDIGSVMDMGGISTLDTFDLDGAYRTISDAMNHSAWEFSTEPRMSNLSRLLDHHNFHCAIDGILAGIRVRDGGRRRQTSIRAHHRQPLWKKFADPLYIRARRWDNRPRP